MPRVISLLRPDPETSYLPKICQAKRCLKTPAPGEIVCAEHLKAYNWPPGFHKEVRREHQETLTLPRPRKKHRKLINIVGNYAHDCVIIYMIRMGESGPIKIGKTNDLGARIDALQTASPYKLNCLATLHAPEELELQLHAYLDEYRLEGEWFKPEADVLHIVALFLENDIDTILSLFEQRLAENE